MDNGEATEMTTAITKPTASVAMAIAPRSIPEVMQMAATVARSGLWGVKSPEDAFVRICTGDLQDSG